MMALAIAGGALLPWQVGLRGHYYEAGPGVRSVVVLVVGSVGAGLFVQGMREWLSLRVFGLSVLLLWMVPFFAMMIMYSAFKAWVAGTYVGLPCPPVLQVYSLGAMMESTTTLPGVEGQFLPKQLADRAEEITTVGAVGYATAGALVQLVRLRSRSRLRALGLRIGGAVDAA